MSVKGLSWHHTSLFVKNLQQNVEFFETHFGFQRIATLPLPSVHKTITFLGIFESKAEADAVPKDPLSREAKEFLVACKHQTLLALKHDEQFTQPAYANGNQEPHRGFGHIAVHCDDVYAACATLEQNGVAFQKKPDDGNMKGLAFALSPENVWIEIIKRHEGHSLSTPFNLSQTMLRVKDAQRSLDFYQRVLGFKTVCEKHFDEWKFSLYFLQQPGKDGSEAQEGWETMHATHRPVLELTHNHGTEQPDAPAYYTQQVGDDGVKPVFAQTSFLVADASQAADEAVAAGATLLFKDSAAVKGVAFVRDPDGYNVEFIDARVIDN